MAEESKERLETGSLEEEVENLRAQVFKMLELCLPPKEVRKEVIKNVYTIELSVLKIFKTLLDYQVDRLEKKVKAPEKKKAKRVKIE